MLGLGAVCALLLGTAHLAAAAEFIVPQDNQSSVMLGNSESHKNVYTAGQSVTVDSSVEGDLTAAGGSILVNGTADDIMVAGGDIHINNGARGDIRAMGGTIIISGTVGGDVLVAGGTIRIAEGATINGDVIVAGGEVSIDGPVKGQVKIAGGKVRFNSAIAGDVNVQAGELSIGPKADIANKISYKGENEAKVEEGGKVAGIDFHKVAPKRGRHLAGIVTIGFVLKLLASIAAAILLTKLFPRTAKRVIGHIESHPWSDLGIGFVGLVIIPVCALLLLVTFVGSYIAALAFFGYIFVLLIACIAAAVLVGSLIIKLLTKKPNLAIDWQAIVIGVVAVGILKFIPVVGWLAIAVAMLMAFGALLRTLKGHIDSEQSSTEGEQISAQLPLNN